MIGTTISHYRILEKLGEVRNFPASVFQRAEENFRIPLSEAKAVAVDLWTVI